jgi:colicin import membrane protein
MIALAYQQPYRSRPYQLPAGILTLLVHVAFFALLYFGIHWQAQPSQGMEVELWASLPDQDERPQPPAAPPSAVKKLEVVKPASPVAPSRADIELAVKKSPIKPKESVKPQAMAKPELKPKLSKAQRQARAEQEELEHQQEQIENQQLAQRKHEQAEKDAARGRVMNEYIGKISAKIKHRIKWPQKLAVEAKAKFKVTLLPGGDVMEPVLVQSSGNKAYDDAVRRAIWSAVPLPLPDDEDMKRVFRDLNLEFSPKEEE